MECPTPFLRLFLLFLLLLQRRLPALASCGLALLLGTGKNASQSSASFRLCRAQALLLYSLSHLCASGFPYEGSQRAGSLQYPNREAIYHYDQSRTIEESVLLTVTIIGIFYIGKYCFLLSTWLDEQKRKKVNLAHLSDWEYCTSLGFLCKVAAALSLLHTTLPDGSYQDSEQLRIELDGPCRERRSYVIEIASSSLEALARQSSFLNPIFSIAYSGSCPVLMVRFCMCYSSFLSLLDLNPSLLKITRPLRSPKVSADKEIRGSRAQVKYGLTWR